jgi:hypothetical protein
MRYDAWDRGFKVIMELTFPANSGWFHNDTGLLREEGEHKYFTCTNNEAAEEMKVDFQQEEVSRTEDCVDGCSAEGAEVMA